MSTDPSLILRAIDALRKAPQRHSMRQLAEDLTLSESACRQALNDWFELPLPNYLAYLVPDFAPQRAAENGSLFQRPLPEHARLEAAQIVWCERPAPDAPPLALRVGIADTLFGPAVGLASPKGLLALGFAAQTGLAACRADLLKRWPQASIREDEAGVAALIGAAMQGAAPLHVMGSPFQLRVWQALAALRQGELLRYGDIAARIGAPRAAQAVGTAVGQNPLSWVLPCHLILPARPEAGGYHWGALLKQAMLAREIAWADAGRSL